MIKVPANSISNERSLDLQMARHLLAVFLQDWAGSWEVGGRRRGSSDVSSSYNDTDPIGLGPHPYDLI